MRNLRPSITRQIVSSMVFLVADYASVVWSPGASAGTINNLRALQRIAAQTIIHSFKTFSLEIAETEAAIQPTAQRLRTTTLSKHCSFPAARFLCIKQAYDVITSSLLSLFYPPILWLLAHAPSVKPDE